MEVLQIESAVTTEGEALEMVHVIQDLAAIPWGVVAEHYLQHDTTANNLILVQCGRGYER
jgi:hypothetical protein